ncbi:MAG: PAS domain S-box protein [Proteobacteria bacterium]|nr:PAS domain S-box protein [Pseudomonadota bacterium]
MDDKVKILFLCGSNSCRSQMAEGFMSTYSGANVEALSAGVTAGGVHPKSIEVMGELDIDISQHKSKTTDDLGSAEFDIVVTLCDSAREYCASPNILDPSKTKDEEYSEKKPLFLGNPAYLDWKIDDPASVKGSDNKVLAAFRAARDILKNEVQRLIDSGYLKALTRQRRHTEKLADLLEDGVAIHDENRRFYLFNKVAEELTGYSRHEAMGMDCHKLFPPNGLCGGQCQFANLKKPLPRKAREYEISFTNHEGTQKNLNVSSSPLELGFNTNAVLITFRDNTELNDLRWKLKQSRSFHGMVGISPAIMEVFETIKSVASSDYPVLVTGESGTGKELVSNAIHYESSRNGGPFVPVNCGALPENILESELFGHVRGAFTGAIKEKKGRFELADGGTLFLDEVGELSQTFQVKLLRVLQEKRFERVGGEKTIEVDVRIIAATNQDLRQKVEQGSFREDLFYRLCVVPISLPPLRIRTEDIPSLVEHILERVRKETKKKIVGVQDKAMDLLVVHSWPGNIRELINALQFASVRCNGKKIKKEDLPIDIQKEKTSFAKPQMSSVTLNKDPILNPIEQSPGSGDIPLAGTLPNTNQRKTKLNAQSVEQALMEAQGNKVKAAKLLGVGRATLYRFLTDHPI